MASTSHTPDQQLPMDPDGPTGKLCTWVDSVTLDDIPPELRTRAKYLILDGLACGLTGAHLPWSEKAANAIFEMEPAGTSSVFGWDRKIGPLSAALLNSTFIQGFELDDWHGEAPMHLESIVLPALFAAAEHQKNLASSGAHSNNKNASKTPGTAFLLAWIVGCEVGPRVGLGLYGGQMLTSGWHSGAVFGPAASSAAVSKLLQLPAHLVEDALGIACTQACGLMSAQYESDVKRMQHGFAARSGLLGALLARSGYVGIKKVFEREYGGFLAMFGKGSGQTPPYRVEEVAKGLGETWQTEAVRVKLYASMAGTHCTVDCLRAMREKHPEELQDLASITAITIKMGEALYHHGGWKAERPVTATGAQMSNAYIAATYLVDGQVLPAQFRHDQLDRDTVWDLVGKTTCVLDADAPTSGVGRVRQTVTVSFADKPALSQTLQAQRGIDPAVTNEEIRDKWRMLAREVIDEQRLTQIEELVLGLEGCEDVAVLGELMAGVTRNPIA